MSELEIRKQVVTEIEQGLVALLEKLEKVEPGQAAGLLGVSLGMLAVLGDARKPKST